MRSNEPETVVRILSKPPLSLPVKVIDAKKRFMNALKGLEDAEEKRIAFREAFYRTLAEVAVKEKCKFLVQGTIAPDVIETKKGVKTQHNVLAQIGIDPIKKFGFHVVEPISSLYKPQVREVARYLKVPSMISERQPFCGPGLSVRCVGLIRPRKLEELRKATAIVEKELAGKGAQQYFAAIIDNVLVQDPANLTMCETIARHFDLPKGQVSVKILRSKATGVRRGKRVYGKIALVTVKTKARRVYEPAMECLIKLQKKLLRDHPAFSRILYNLVDKVRKGPFITAIRAIQTRDFITADVMPLNWKVLKRTASLIMKACPGSSSVHYDITPKPPATIEFE